MEAENEKNIFLGTLLLIIPGVSLLSAQNETTPVPVVADKQILSKLKGLR